MPHFDVEYYGYFLRFSVPLLHRPQLLPNLFLSVGFSGNVGATPYILPVVALEQSLYTVRLNSFMGCCQHCQILAIPQNRDYKGWNLRQAYNGNGQGPYWHAYKRVNTKLKHKYLGKNLPANLDEILGLNNNEFKKQMINLAGEKYEITKITVEVMKEGIKENIVLYKTKDVDK